MYQSLHLSKILKKIVTSLYFQSSRTEASNDKEEESAPLSTRKKAPSSVELDRSKEKTSPMSASSNSARSRVTNCTCERLENDAASSVSKHPALRTFKGESGDTTFKDGCDSDGDVHPFFDTVEVEEKQEEMCDEVYVMSHAPSNSSISDV